MHQDKPCLSQCRLTGWQSTHSSAQQTSGPRANSSSLMRPWKRQTRWRSAYSSSSPETPRDPKHLWYSSIVPPRCIRIVQALDFRAAALVLRPLARAAWLYGPPVLLPLQVFVNPHGGHRLGMRTWESVRPIFLRAGIALSVVCTERRGQAHEAMERMGDEELSRLDGLVVVVRPMGGFFWHTLHATALLPIILHVLCEAGTQQRFTAY